MPLSQWNYGWPRGDCGAGCMGKKQQLVEAAYDQACAIPYRYWNNRLEFCLITSSRKKRWGFPKGIIDPGETPGETALKEADEEAGLTGRIRGLPLGDYCYHKWGRDLEVVVWLMEVKEAADEWDESDVRRRRWVSADDVSRVLQQDSLRPLVKTAMKRLAKQANR